MATKYRMKSLAGPFLPGRTVTDEEIKAAGGDLEFWKRTGAVEEVKDGDAAATADEAPKTSEAVNADIEARIRNETVRLGRALTGEEQDKVVGDVKGENAPKLEAAANPAKRVQPAPPPGPSGETGDNRTLYGHKLSVYRRRAADKTGDARVAALMEVEGIGEARANEIAAALDEK